MVARVARLFDLAAGVLLVALATVGPPFPVWARSEAQLMQALRQNYDQVKSIDSILEGLISEGQSIIERSGPPAAKRPPPPAPAHCDGVMLLGICSATGSPRR